MDRHQALELAGWLGLVYEAHWAVSCMASSMLGCFKLTTLQCDTAMLVDMGHHYTRLRKDGPKRSEHGRNMWTFNNPPMYSVCTERPVVPVAAQQHVTGLAV